MLQSACRLRTNGSGSLFSATHRPLFSALYAIPTFVNVVQECIRRHVYRLESRADVTAPAIRPSSGTAHLRFVRSGASTVLTRALAASPAKLIETNVRGNACWVYTATLGGGLVGGDEIAMTVEVSAGGRALLTTQASTKVYRSERQSTQFTTASVDEGGLLAVMPDPVVCFAGSNYRQVQRYDLHADATLVVVDAVTSGRHAAGERWAFSRYESRLHISRDRQALVCDAVVLERELDSVAERMGRFDIVLTAVATGPLVASSVGRLLDAVAAAPLTRGNDIVVSAARLRDGGALIRMAGESVELLGCTLRKHFSFLSPLLGDDFWSRKR
jgi:urease accessory protein